MRLVFRPAAKLMRAGFRQPTALAGAVLSRMTILEARIHRVPPFDAFDGNAAVDKGRVRLQPVIELASVDQIRSRVEGVAGAQRRRGLQVRGRAGNEIIDELDARACRVTNQRGGRAVVEEAVVGRR